MYQADLIAYLRFRVPRGQRILHCGCRSTSVLEHLQPQVGVGVVVEPSMADGERLLSTLDDVQADEPFDYILLEDYLGRTEDVQVFLESLHRFVHRRTRILIFEYSRLWDPLLKIHSSIVGDKRRNWLSPGDILNFTGLTGFDTVSFERRAIMPLGVPIVAPICNRVLVQLPGLRHLATYNVITVRPVAKVAEKPGLSVVIPARNEAGNIENAVKRMPRLDGKTQIIFVEGGSSDHTWDEIQRVAEAYKDDWDIVVTRQPGIGKGDAVRHGFELATEEVLTILDADLTMPPEELPKYYRAYCDGHAEFVNGCRLVYPLEQESMRFLNMIANHLFSHLFSWLLGQRIRDTLCGTKMLSREDYEQLVANRGYFGEFDPFGDFDLIFGAARLNLKIVDMPIHYKAREYGETNISRWRHGLLLIRMAAFAMWKIKFR